MRLSRITSIRKINFLEENKIYPKYENYDEAWYERTPQFLQLLEDYKIQHTFYESTKRRNKK